METVCTVIFLLINAREDLKKHEISPVATAVFAFGSVLAGLHSGKSVWETGGAMLIGVMILAFSLVTKGAVGMGDGWIILALGTALPAMELLGTLMLAALCCAGCAGILLVFKKMNRNTEIPFVPFVLAGYLGGMLL